MPPKRSISQNKYSTTFHKNKQNWLYAKRPKQTKTSNNAQIYFSDTQPNMDV